jgi:hypothetical protein
MRKHIINVTESDPRGTSEEWLNLEEIARVEVSSEDPSIQSNRHSSTRKLLVGVPIN